MNRNLLQVKYHFLYGRLCHNKRLLTLFSLLISYKNKNQNSAIKRFLIPRSAGERETARGGAWQGGGAWRPGRERTFKIKKRGTGGGRADYDRQEGEEKVKLWMEGEGRGGSWETSTDPHSS